MKIESSVNYPFTYRVTTNNKPKLGVIKRRGSLAVFMHTHTSPLTRLLVPQSHSAAWLQTKLRQVRDYRGLAHA